MFEPGASAPGSNTVFYTLTLLCSEPVILTKFAGEPAQRKNIWTEKTQVDKKNKRSRTKKTSAAGQTKTSSAGQKKQMQEDKQKLN